MLDGVQQQLRLSLFLAGQSSISSFKRA